MEKKLIYWVKFGHYLSIVKWATRNKIQWLVKQNPKRGNLLNKMYLKMPVTCITWRPFRSGLNVPARQTKCTKHTLFLFQTLSKQNWNILSNTVKIPSHKFHNASDNYPTTHHFVTEMCTHVHISVTEWRIVGYGTGALWDLYNMANSYRWSSARL